MNQRISGLFQLGPGESAHGLRFDPRELAPQPRVRAITWLLLAAVFAAGMLGLLARAYSEAGTPSSMAAVEADPSSAMSAFTSR
ncbi:MAG: hypothetical protein IPN34_18010 [Planctomycetes bacterium]|nr:hypothetical protein [Planctomycetota bacterium]